MSKKTSIFFAVFVFAALFFAVEVSAANLTKFYGKISHSYDDAIGGDISNTIISFQNGDVFCISEMAPYADGGNIEKSIFIPGEHIKVSFFDSRNNFVTQLSPLDLPLKTLYVSTDKCNAVVSIGAVYNADKAHSTVVPVTSKEVPLTCEAILYPERGYMFRGYFTLNKSENAQMWYLLSNDTKSLFYSTRHEFTMDALKLNELSTKDHRLLSDGFYFEAPTSYSPYRKGMLYRHPSCYTGVSYARYGACPMMDEIGYAAVRLSAENQNSQGFWATPLYVDWLKKDFNIGENFYDTRFNTDFATGLADTYEKFHDDYLLDALFKYTNFFINYAEENHIETYHGFLVCDYGGGEKSKKTHSSLNHHASEIIYLNYLYDLLEGMDEETSEKFAEYDFVKDHEIISALAKKMLAGIRDTEKFWIMPDNNLRYAFGYSGTANTMTDYPYLTYNDLFNLNKQIKAKIGSSNPTLENLMQAKMSWMTKNGITGYLTQ